MSCETHILDLAQRELDAGDPSQAAFVLRDTQMAKDAGMTDLLWSLYRGDVYRNDVQPLIDELRYRIGRDA